MANALMALVMLLVWIAWALVPLSHVWSRPTLLGWVLAGGWAIGMLGGMLLAIIRPDWLHAIIYSPKSRR